MAIDPEHSAKPVPPALARRMAAMAYDAFLLTAVLFVATAALLPFTGGEAISPGNGLYTLYLAAVSFGYLGWFWTHGGQTLGMRSWQLRLAGAGQNGATWRQASMRFVGACVSWAAFGAGFLWMLVDRERLTWHDRISGTRIFDAL
jgi:uncharacterized RDD family membrane protein YckC